MSVLEAQSRSRALFLSVRLLQRVSNLQPSSFQLAEREGWHIPIARGCPRRPRRVRRGASGRRCHCGLHELAKWRFPIARGCPRRPRPVRRGASGRRCHCGPDGRAEWRILIAQGFPKRPRQVRRGASGRTQPIPLPLCQRLAEHPTAKALPAAAAART